MSKPLAANPQNQSMHTGSHGPASETNSRVDSRGPEKLVFRRSFRSLWGYWVLFFASFPVGVRLRDQFPDFVWFVSDFLGDGLGDIPITMFIVLPLVILFLIFWLRYDSKYTIGPKGVVVTTGILGAKRRTAMAEYTRIQGASAQESVVGQLLNFGDIMMGTSETSESELQFRGVINPTSFVQLIVARMEQARGASGR